MCSSDRPNKLSPRSTRCVSLGYPSKHRGYRCLDLHTRKIIISRHVTFDENSFPYSTPNTSSPATPPNDPQLDYQPPPILHTPTPPNPAATHQNSAASSISLPRQPAPVLSPAVGSISLPRQPAPVNFPAAAASQSPVRAPPTPTLHARPQSPVQPRITHVYTRRTPAVLPTPTPTPPPPVIHRTRSTTGRLPPPVSSIVHTHS